ncbi:MAG: NFACT family protein [Defluviitaleaceae bacterium]|nr:NFACT family protein [Defluviitaleaceae bacterium]
MPLDGITLNSVVQELSSTLIGGRVDKIQLPEPDELIMAIRSGGQNYKLLLTASANNPRVNLTGLTKISPAQAPMFCMLLRKHLGGGRILNIAQPDFERIVEFYIESPNEMGDLSIKKLIVEIMGKHSNIILVNADDVIMDSIRHVSQELSSVREVLPGREYVRPPSQGKIAPSPTDKNSFLALFHKDENAGKRAQQIIYQSYNGISPVMGSEICHRAGIPADAFPEAISVADRITLFEAFTHLYEDVAKGQFKCLIYEGEKRDFSAIPLTIYNHLEKSQPFASPSEMLEVYYRRQDNHYRLAQKTADLRKLVTLHIERCQRKAQVFNDTLLEIKDREQLRHYGELLTAYIYTIPAGADRAKVPDFYDEDGAKEIEIPLNPTLTPSENAQHYFKGYNKAKRTFIALQDQIKANADDLAYLDSVLAAIDTTAEEEDIADIRAELAEEGFLKKRYYQHESKGRKGQRKQAQKKSKPLHYRSADGFDIYVGKNNTQNDELTLRFAHPTDIWMHTKEIAGSHVIIQSGGRSIPDSTILEGAMLAAYHSKGRQSSQVPVDYVARRHVRKPKGAKPGFVIYDGHKTVYVTPEGEPNRSHFATS